MLLAQLAHALTLPTTDAAAGPLRSRLIKWVYGEMVDRQGESSLPDLARKLTTLPLGMDPKQMAGPPFELPYSLAVPDRGPDRWRLHLDFLEASKKISETIDPRLKSDPATADPILASLRNFDETDDMTGTGAGRRAFINAQTNSPF